ncbi:hypothetical protein MG293_017361 [Ovis ammon polii]|uniref:Uncharacterized protein n=1 Tax=Ovis ammon polii TaxID=230172 RepID=A0AAD4TSX1_OVIAM|nr:hypothetical protein MG293_017361 [Ovis ammon polii]
MIEWSGCHFLKVFKRYQSYRPCDMLQSIKKGVKGDLENVFLNLVQCIQNKPLYFADRREQPLNILNLEHTYTQTLKSFSKPGRANFSLPWKVLRSE